MRVAPKSVTADITSVATAIKLSLVAGDFVFVSTLPLSVGSFLPASFVVITSFALSSFSPFSSAKSVPQSAHL